MPPTTPTRFRMTAPLGRLRPLAVIQAPSAPMSDGECTGVSSYFDVAARCERRWSKPNWPRTCTIKVLAKLVNNRKSNLASPLIGSLELEPAGTTGARDGISTVLSQSGVGSCFVTQYGASRLI